MKRYILILSAFATIQLNAQQFFLNFKDGTSIPYPSQIIQFTSGNNSHWSIGNEYHNNFDVNNLSSVSNSKPIVSDTCKLAVITTGSLNSEDIAKPIFDQYPILNLFLSGNMKELDYYNVHYPTVDARGHTMIMSGRICMRQMDVANKSVKGIILMNHYTITRDVESPSVSPYTYADLFANTGYAVVMADYLGFGITKDYPQTYLHAESTAKQCLDLLRLSRKWLAEQGINCNSEVYNIGYSQGGGVSMDVQRFAEASNVKLTKTMAGGGPYDLVGTYDEIIKQQKTNLPVEIPLFVVGMNYAYNFGFDYSKIFKEPLLSNYDEWLNSKTYNTNEISTKIGTQMISDIVQSDFLDSSNKQNIQFRNAMLLSSTTTGWTSKVLNPILIFHSTDDEVVPVLNANEMKAKLQSDGYTDANLTAVIKSMGTHSNTGGLFNIYCYCVISGLNIPISF